VGVWGYHRDSASRATAGEYTAEDGRSNAGSGRREGQANVSHIVDLRISIVIDASWIRQQCCSKSPSTGPDCVPGRARTIWNSPRLFLHGVRGHSKILVIGVRIAEMYAARRTPRHGHLRTGNLRTVAGGGGAYRH
jgi:hypothetical protein